MSEIPAPPLMASAAGQRRVTALTPHYFPQLWLLVVSFGGFGLYVAWDLGLLAIVYTLDRSYIAMLITALVVAASGHAAWHVTIYSRRILEASRHLARLRTDGLGADLNAGHNTTATAIAGQRDDGFVTDFLLQLADNDTKPSVSGRASPLGNTTADTIVEMHADRLRSPVDLGWFLVDLAVRLGLFGTIIGFILIFTSLADTSISAEDGLRDLLVSMSGGMGTALFTTLTGLIGGSFLSFQYLILGRQSETLIGLLMRLALPARSADGVAEQRP